MRYGIVRSVSGLDGAVQRAALDQIACDAILDDDGLSAEFTPRMKQLCTRLSPGDQIVVQDLKVLPAESIIVLLPEILRAGASLRIVSGKPIKLLRPTPDVIHLLTLLMQTYPVQQLGAQPRPRARRHRGALTRYQVKHARRLYNQGMSIREIGMVFRMAPEEISPLLGPEARGRVKSG